MSWFDRLFRRRGDAGGTRSDAAGSPTDGTVQAEILDAHGWRMIWLGVTAARVSDAINAEAADLVPRLEDGTPVDLDDVLMLIPPDHPAGDPSRRLHRPVHPLWVRIGECSVVGLLHLPPGSVGSAYLLRRSHQFFVLTNAKITRSVSESDGREERQVPVLLVNLHQVSSLRDTPEPEHGALVAPPA
jgi:hypothetical protein